ncbi:hypothetical protein K458DRAFT_452793 [Lentithecium fluviatile CBS 122367]|uniref:Uncharacterized protein n=1 Tax=Lentithecium fluviatile CBS 122367 TaxID=1168545 RepID=A0A6G1IZC1_9PLEO|nr:hypothetical protein K458DRAFT_452793 [Lentithecium fluviatile CBS 122367]
MTSLSSHPAVTKPKSKPVPGTVPTIVSNSVRTTMAGGRPRPNPLHIPIPHTHQWCAPRPPTPRRSTYPQPGTTSADMPCDIDLDAPPVPPLSFWEPDTPEALMPPSSSYSPCNPFFYSPPHSPLSPNALFPTASPVLPASPLSIFDRILSPMTPTFLFPRTPPLPLSLQKEMLMVRRHSTMCLMPQVDLEKIQYDGISEMSGAIRERVLMEVALKRQDAVMNETGKSEEMSLILKTRKSEGTSLNTKTGKNQKEIKRLLKWKGFVVVKDLVVNA